MHLVRSHRLLYVHVPQVVLNLVFWYIVRDFAPLEPILQFISWGGARREAASED